MCHHRMPEMVAALAGDGDHRHDPDAQETEQDADEPADRDTRLIA